MEINIYLHGAAEERVLRQIDEKLNLILKKETEMSKTLASLLRLRQVNIYC